MPFLHARLICEIQFLHKIAAYISTQVKMYAIWDCLDTLTEYVTLYET